MRKTKNINFKQGFTLIELLITVLIIAILLGIASYPLLNFLSANRLKQNVIGAQQILQEARNYAITKSKNVDVIFTTSKVTAQTAGGTVLAEFDFENRVIFDTGNSALISDKITFNFKGSPLGDDGTVSSFSDESNGKIVMCFTSSSGNNCVRSKTMYILPVTGIVKVNE